LVKADVETLRQYQFKLDDQMISGDLSVVTDSMKIVNARIKKVEEWRKEVFKKNFDFTVAEKLELDPDKREFSANEEELKVIWTKTFKQATLSRYLDLLAEQEELRNPKDTGKDKKKDKDKKNDKKKSGEVTKDMKPEEIMKKATEAIATKYERFFTRLAKEDRDDYLERFYNSISGVFDPHTNYLPPKKKEDFDIDISGSLEGIGAVLQEDGQYIKVVSIVPGGAAWRQKELEVEDTILSVGQGAKEPVSLVDMRVDDAVRYIRGPKGTEVQLTVKKVDGSRKVIKITRDVVEIGASFAKSSILEHKKLNHKIGYIHVPKFYRDFSDSGDTARNCSDDVKKEIESLKKKNVEGVILDLRGNGGGALEDARVMAGLFIEEGPIVQIKNHKGGVEILKDFDVAVQYDGPLIVLINRFSASASEIVAAALQDYKRAVIVGGEYSHGKGTVQAVLNLNQAPLLSMFGATMGALKVTIQKFYRVNGSSTQYKGVTPDIILPDNLGYAKNREQDLDYSLKWDQVESLKYKSWEKYHLDTKLLSTRSAERARKDSRMQKVSESVSYLTKRRDETLVSLNLEEVKKEEKQNEEMTKKLKLEDVNEDILVTNFEESLQTAQDVKPGDEDKWKKDFEQRKDEWIKGLRQDPVLEESLFIMSDMLAVLNGKKLSMAK
jgi:carboxyl-terminal processing protease